MSEFDPKDITHKPREHAGQHPDPSVREVPQEGFENYPDLTPAITEANIEHFNATVEAKAPDPKFHDTVLLERAGYTTTPPVTQPHETQPEKKSRKRLWTGLAATGLAGALAIGFGAKSMNDDGKDPAPKPPATPTLITPDNTPSVPPTSGVETPAPTPTSSVEAPVVNAAELLELSPTQFNELKRNDRLVAVHLLMQEATTQTGLYGDVETDDYDLPDFNPIVKLPSKNDDGQSILNQYRFARQLAFSQRQDPKDNFNLKLDKKRANAALSAGHYNTSADEVHLNDFDALSEAINKPGDLETSFSTQKYTLVAESELKTSVDIDGNQILYKDIVYTSSKSPDKKMSNSFIFNTYTVDGKDYHIWQEYLDS